VLGSRYTGATGANSILTRGSGTYNSSARIEASVVLIPCPISDWETTNVTELSGEIRTQGDTDASECCGSSMSVGTDMF